MRINVEDVIMQGSVWSSLKFTTSMDRLNQTALSDEFLKYCYKGDPEVPISDETLMFHHEILTQDKNETIRKVYNKQK